MCTMGAEGGPDPAGVQDVAALVALMRELREHSGLTYRRLQQRAAERGMVLARSTISDVLARDALPRPEVLTAFVVACGEEPRVGEWLEARERVADSQRERAPGARTGSRRAARLWSRLRSLPVAAAVLALGYGLFGVVLPRSGDDERPPARTPAAEKVRDPEGPFSLFEARSTKGATIASVGYRYWDTKDGWYGIEYVMPLSRDDREAYDDGWGGRLIMHYEDGRGSHTAVLVDNPDGEQDVGENGVRHGLKNVWFEVCDAHGAELRGCQRLRKARTHT